jgi:hypothetical protein
MVLYAMNLDLMPLSENIMIGKKNQKIVSQINLDPKVLSKMYPLFAASYNYLLGKYDKYELTVAETLKEIQMSPTDFYLKKKKGKGIPIYRQKDEKSRITFPLVCIALFLSQDFKSVD